MTEIIPPMIEIENLSTDYISRSGLFNRKERRVRALDSMNLVIWRGEAVGVVGESGCGKTTLGLSLLRLIEPCEGKIFFQGVDLLSLDRASLRRARREIQMLFQNPFTSLNPRMKVFDLVSEPLRTHTNLQDRALKVRVNELLAEVGMEDEHLGRLPHQLSGGQAQRAALARALALNPSFLVLDEPTSALDVSVQAQVINLLVKLKRSHGLTYLFITHDLSVIEHFSDRVVVMYLGQAVEIAPCEACFKSPHHPYTQALLSATPLPDPDSKQMRIILKGNIPSPANPPAGCRFHTRCPQVMDICRNVVPEARFVADDHWAACHLLDV